MLSDNELCVEHGLSECTLTINEHGVMRIRTWSAIYLVELVLNAGEIKHLCRLVSEAITANDITPGTHINIAPSDGCLIIGNSTLTYHNKQPHVTRMVDSFYLGISSFHHTPFVIQSADWNEFVVKVESIIGPVAS